MKSDSEEGTAEAKEARAKQRKRTRSEPVWEERASRERKYGVMSVFCMLKCRCGFTCGYHGDFFTSNFVSKK